MDNFIVRLSILVLTSFIAFSICYAWNGVLISEYDSLFSCSLISGILLNVLVYSQGKYHCVYMRGLSGNLIFTPAINYLDGKYVLFDNAETFLTVLSASWILSFIITTILAINHFTKVRKLKRKQYEIRRRNEIQN